MRKGRGLIVGLSLLALATTALVVTVMSRHSAQRPVAFTPPIVGAPPPNSVVFAREAGDLAVALAVELRRSSTLVATVLGPDGLGLSGLDVTLELETATGAPRSGAGRDCGSGCYEATLTGITGRPTAVTVELSGHDRSTSARFALPRAWPPPPAGKLVRQATAAYGRLRTLVIHERLASDTTHSLNTVYRAAAPDRLHLASNNGTQSIIIGNRRWDKTPGQPWRESPQSPLQSVRPFWVTTPVDPHLLGSGRVAGRAVWVVSFVTPQVPAWFTIWIDKQTHRTLELRMTAAAHFMHHTYGPFNAPLTITPPRR